MQYTNTLTFYSTELPASIYGSLNSHLFPFILFQLALIMVLKINLPPVVVKRAGRQSHLTIKITTCPRMFLKSLNFSKKRPQKRTSMDSGTPVTPRLYGSVRYGSPSTRMVTDGRAGSTCKKPTVLNSGLRCTEYSQLSIF